MSELELPGRTDDRPGSSALPYGVPTASMSRQALSEAETMRVAGALGGKRATPPRSSNCRITACSRLASCLQLR